MTSDCKLLVDSKMASIFPPSDQGTNDDDCDLRQKNNELVDTHVHDTGQHEVGSDIDIALDLEDLFSRGDGRLIRCFIAT